MGLHSSEKRKENTKKKTKKTKKTLNVIGCLQQKHIMCETLICEY